MRRLAVQSRDDAYSSRRDYQSVEHRQAQRFMSTSAQGLSLAFRRQVVREDGFGLIAWGAYLKCSKPGTIEATLTAAGSGHTWRLEVGSDWQRVGGIVCFVGQSAELEVLLCLRAQADWIDIWGLDADAVRVTNDGRDLELDDINKTHLTPEAFYLGHTSAIDLDIDEDNSSSFGIDFGDAITVKKCSYCGRYLPLDSSRLGALAFHKHNAKLSNHQNECRACKKLRINDSLNVIRTTDQLHESSVITRERKVLLREPEILQKIKERTGSGLKSQVWNRFGKKCFRCLKAVTLNGFQLDHTRPLAYLWPIDEFATCLCAECNNEKKEKFPLDFYTGDQLQRLSAITGLPLYDLRKKDVNEEQLVRILADLSGFARSWEARTFVATGRKIRELRPDVDLMALLRDRDPVQARALENDLARRTVAAEEQE